MTSPSNDSSTGTVRQLPLDDSIPKRKQYTPEELAQVRAAFAAECSSSPLYQARAARDPEYWNMCSIGRVR